MRAIVADSSSSSPATIRAREARGHRIVRPLEEHVDDLDLVRPRAEAGERVDEPLHAVLVLHHLVRRQLTERVRLVVDDERAPARRMEEVEETVEEHAVVLERERPLGLHAVEIGDARGERGGAVGLDEPPDPLDLVVRRLRVPRPHLLGIRRSRRSRIDALEQPVHRVAELGREQAACTVVVPLAGNCDRPALAHPRDSLGKEAVGAALEERDRAVGEAANVVERRRGQRLERGQNGGDGHACRRPPPRTARAAWTRQELPPRPAPPRRPAPDRAARPSAGGARRPARSRPAPPQRAAGRRPARHAGAPSRSASRPPARDRARRRRSAGRSHASSRRSRGAAARRDPPPRARLAPRRTRTLRAACSCTGRRP